jgi:ankyrin repeat protein
MFIKDKNWDSEYMYPSNEKSTPIEEATSHNHTDIVLFFLQHEPTKGLQETLIAAAKRGNNRIIEALFENCKDRLPENFVNLTSSCNTYYGKSTALMFAAQNGYLDTVKLLIQHGADIHLKGNLGKTALYFAQNRGHQNTVDYLKSMKSSTETPDPAKFELMVFQKEECANSGPMKKIDFDGSRADVCRLIQMKTPNGTFLIYGENMSLMKL